MANFTFSYAKLAWLWPLALGVGTAYVGTAVFDMPGLRADPPEPPKAEKRIDRGYEYTRRVNAVRARNIVNLAEPAAKPKPPPGPDPASWKLMGILTGAQPMALINIQGPKIVKVGDVHHNWTLTEVTPRSITWKGGDVERVIELFAKKVDMKLEAGKVNKVPLAKQDVAPYLSDPNAMLQQALFRPHLERGGVQGFRISNIKDNSLFKRMGLKNGDILQRINGETITGPGKLLEVYSGLSKAEAVSVDLRRGGQYISLLIEIK